MHDIGFPGTFEKQYCLSFPPFSTHDRGTFSTLGEKKVQHRKERSLIAKETRSPLWARRKTFRCSYFLKMIYCSNYALVLFKSSQENEVISTLDFFFPSPLSFQFNYCSEVCNGKNGGSEQGFQLESFQICPWINDGTQTSDHGLQRGRFFI